MIGLCSSGFDYIINTNDIEVAIIQFTIVDDQLTSDIAWIYNGATATDGTVVFLCDNATQLSSQDDDNSCLDGLNINVPIELKDFGVKAVNNMDSYLEWTTSSEINGSHFEIEMSADGLIWEYIASVESVGNSYSEEKYDYTHENAIKEIHFGSKAYYRLRMVDLDGTYKYSPARAVQFESGDINVKFFPNPTYSLVNLRLSPDLKLQKGKIKITDFMGKLIGQLQIEDDKSTDIRIELSDFGISNGVYWIIVSDGNNLISDQRIIVVD